MLAALAAAVVPAVPARAVVIDSFLVEQALVRSGAGTVAGLAEGAPADILGGERDVRVTVASGSGTLRVDVGASEPGTLSHAAAGRVTGTTEISYDGADGDALLLAPLGLEGVDLTEGGAHDRIAIGVAFADLGAVLRLTVWSSPSHCSVRSVTVPPGITPADGHSAVFRFAEFVPGSGCTGGADFRNVGALSLLIDGSGIGATDLALKGIETLPGGTPTPSATATPAPATPTPAATATVPPTPTPSAAGTPPATPVCGNGVVEGTEACDDGNAADLDGCENDCSPSPCLNNSDRLIPGYCHTRRNDCYHEFCSASTPVPTTRFDGLPGNLLRCTDDDPACDHGLPGDRGCTFRVALCFNVQDPRLACFGQPPAGVEHVRLRRVEEDRAVDVANRNALEAALVALGGTLEATGISRVIRFSPPLMATDQCTRLADFRVPLRMSAQSGELLVGKRLITVITIPPKTGTAAPKQDSDVLVLECVPR